MYIPLHSIPLRCIHYVAITSRYIAVHDATLQYVCCICLVSSRLVQQYVYQIDS